MAREAPNGATIVPQYLERHQEYVGVNRNDLEDLLSYDSDALIFGGVGSFCLSGAVWILVEQALSGPGIWHDNSILTPLAWFCVAACVLGVFALFMGYRQHAKKRGRIKRIFSETRPVNAGASAGLGVRGKMANAKIITVQITNTKNGLLRATSDDMPGLHAVATDEDTLRVRVCNMLTDLDPSPPLP